MTKSWKQFHEAVICEGKIFKLRKLVTTMAPRRMAGPPTTTQLMRSAGTGYQEYPTPSDGLFGQSVANQPMLQIQVNIQGNDDDEHNNTRTAMVDSLPNWVEAPKVHNAAETISKTRTATQDDRAKSQSQGEAMQTPNFAKKLPRCWSRWCKNQFAQPYFQELIQFLEQERETDV